ncbi:putative disease resistance protein RGA4, partial [Mucuna pruriens]
MEASAAPKTFEQILQKIEEIVNDENSKNLFDMIKECDVKATAILKQQLGNVLTGLEKLDTESSSKKASMRFFSKGSSSQIPLNTLKMKAIEDLERIARKAEYLNGTREALVGIAEEGLELVGRKKEKEDIIDQLTSVSRSRDGARRVPVIIIAGLAGIGKTKLASHVCQDREVQNHVGFPTRVICTNYNTFDADSIAKRVIDDTTNSTNRIIILDDWRLEIGDQHVKALQDKLKKAGLCLTAIIITARSCLVPRNIAASPVKLNALPALNEIESVSLFKKTLGQDKADDSSKPMLAKCYGVPQAIMTMAKWQHSPPPRSQFTELTEELIYSYYYDEVLTHLWFTYCSLFPRRYEFDAERLIHLWMAEGFLSSSNLSPEVIGRGYLRNLVERSIFQDVTEDKFGEVKSCKMHPLMHDIARFLADRENINVDLNGDKVHQHVLRASFDLSLGFDEGIPAPLNKAKQLTSILFLRADPHLDLPLKLKMSAKVLKDIFMNFKKLKVLDLRKLNIEEVPSSIEELKDLKYLDLSENVMKELPSSITKLTKLETLKLYDCKNLKKLPKDFKNLAQLKHLDLEGCLGFTDREMSKISALQTLSTFVKPRGTRNAQ